MKSAMLFLGFFAHLVLAQEVEAAAATPTPSQLTLTYTATTTSFVYQTTTVQDLTYYRTANVTMTVIDTSYIYIYKGSPTTVTETDYNPQIYTKPASSTTSLPTVKGFTPILSQSYYHAKIVVVNKTVTSPYTRKFDPTPVFVTETDYTWSHLYTTTLTSSVNRRESIYHTVPNPSTYTRSRPPVESVFAACRPDNLASRIPTGQLIRDLHEQDRDFHISTPNKNDCCTLCQNTPGCYGGGFQILDPGPGYCYLFKTKKVNGTHLCNPRTVHPKFATAPLHPTDRGYYNYRYVAFNGPCGQIGWVLNSATYFKNNVPDPNLD